MTARRRSHASFFHLLALVALVCIPRTTFARPTTAAADTIPPGAPTWRIVPDQRCSGDSLWLEFSWCADCARLDSATRDSGFVLTKLDSCGRDSCRRQSVLVPLGRFAAGTFVLQFVITSHVGSETVVRHESISFAVSRTCSNGPLPYVDAVTFTGQNGRGLCAADSIAAHIVGHFDNDCLVLRRADWVFPTYVNGVPEPRPPIIRLLVDDHGCEDRVCTSDSVAWAVNLVLPPLPAGDYEQPITLSVVSCSDSFPTPPQHTATALLSIAKCESTTAGCFIARFPHRDSSKCDVGVEPGGTARVTLDVATAIPLAGLQGVLQVDPPGLRITALEAVGVAAGMHLTWHPTTSGAAFVMFDQNGAPIGPTLPAWFPWQGQPVLRVTLAAGDHPPAFTRVWLGEALASDSLGREVAACPLPQTSAPDGRFDPFARLCVERPCDANDDGRSDVRDLILMVRCLGHGCADSTRFDCDANGRFDLADVLCCALAILRQHAPPDSGSVPPAGTVAAMLGTPRAAGNVLHVPVTVEGSAQLASALLHLSFPSDRYDFVGLATPTDRSSLLPIQSVEGSELALGYVDLAGLDPGVAVQSAPRIGGTTELDLQLALKPGAQAGGTIDLLDAQFADRDGNRVAVTATPMSVPVVPPDHATLSAARPNPFAGETHFAVDLPRAANVQLSVHDLSGRRIATVFAGALPAGHREFTWNGATDRGDRAANGVYFVHLAAGGEISSRKVVVLGGP